IKDPTHSRGWMVSSNVAILPSTIALDSAVGYSSLMKSMTADDASAYDVVVIGGALSGAATATLLLRQNPGLRLLIVEKSARLTRRVGEATVEVSAYFMGRVLGLTQYLNESHLVKQGLRFWSKDDDGQSVGDESECGG